MTKPLFLILIGLTMGCKAKAKQESVLESTMTSLIDPMVFHLKESNYEIGIVKQRQQWRGKADMLMLAYLKDGRVLYLKDVKKGIYPTETTEVYISCETVRP